MIQQARLSAPISSQEPCSPPLMHDVCRLKAVLAQHLCSKTNNGAGRIWSSRSAFAAGNCDLVSKVPAHVFADAEFSGTKLSKMTQFTEQKDPETIGPQSSPTRRVSRRVTDSRLGSHHSPYS